MPELPQLLLAAAAFSLVLALGGALRRAGRQAVAFAGLVVANLGLCGLALLQPEPRGPLLWAALLGVLLLVVVPRVLGGLQRAALQSHDLGRALALQRWRSWLQPGAHGDGLRALALLGSPDKDPDRVAGLLRPGLEPALRLLVLEVLFAELARAGRRGEMLALLETEGGESLLAVSSRIAASVASTLHGGGPGEVVGRSEAPVAAAPSSASRRPLYRQAPVSLLLLLAIVGVHLLLYLAGPADETAALLRFGGNYRPATLNGEPWRLLSSVFLHGGLLHLVVNAYALFGLGRFVEPLYGGRRLFILFMVAGLCGSAASALLGGEQRLSVGASGAIFGLLGAALMALVRLRGLINEAWRRQVAFNLVVIIALNLWIGYSLKVVDNWAHLGGLLGGAVLGLLLAPRPGRGTSPAAARLLSAAAGLLLAALAGTVALVALTPTSRTIERLPWQSLARAGLRLQVPASMSQDPQSPGVELRDPLLRVASLSARVDLATAGRPLDEELAARARALRQELEQAPEVGAVEELPAGALPAPPGPATVQAGLKLTVGNQQLVELLLLRRDGDLLFQLRALLSASALDQAAPVLGRILSSLRGSGTGGA